jgi:hypothetical protein
MSRGSADVENRPAGRGRERAREDAWQTAGAGVAEQVILP